MDAELARERIGRGLGLSVLLHLLFVLLAWFFAPLLGQLLAPLQGDDATAPQLVQFHLNEVVADVSEASRVDEAPATEILGRFDSQAADRVPGDADAAVPAGGQAGMDNSIPGTGAESEGQAGSGNAATSPAPAQESEGGVMPIQRDALPATVEQMLTGKRESSPGHGARSSSELDEAGALAFGEYAFSTHAWDYEPYWVHMRAKLYGAWHPPVAYTQYGIIQGGWSMVRVVVHRDGTIEIPELLQTEGHESLHRSSLAAMTGAAPFRPLPADFPDDELVVTVRFVYLPGGAPPRNPP
ncbi:MAG TPA: TonB C-terminal domain-containing protein [Candidatus Krumholzibacteria bacterium]|nr:TonB C-terminal domain-containing protein [Candidatus Krumholzibacteria bacterium]